MAAALAAENHVDKWGLNLIFIMRDIYINSNLNPLTKFFSSRGTEFKDILRKISQMTMKTVPRIVVSYSVKQGILFLV